MNRIQEQTLQDLELPIVLDKVSELCVTELGKEKANQIRPFIDEEALLQELYQTSEFMSSFTNNNVFPNHYFDLLYHEIKYLRIENSYLEPHGFRKIYQLVSTANELLIFIKKFKEYYPYIALYAENFMVNKTILQSIDAVLDKYGEIKDGASADLMSIRKNIQLVRGKINQSFGIALTQYGSSGYLDDIRETIVNNRRVLAVLAMYRKKVRGSLLGQSKTGNIVYIEPETVANFSRELSHLEYEEKEEIIKIMRRLTAEISPYVDEIVGFQDFLSQIDVICAKAKYAQRIGGLLPTISKKKRLYFREAYHPILLENNRLSKKETFPQTIELHNENRIIVISGPNAGGKSITLKTIGLLQTMLQSGLLIPVHERSETFFFDRIISDIGDNQSIENHLSTYSYRLKNMNYFLKKANAQTLFLIDEFGTGSDPELGGALAEVFLEEFYERESFGIITTHYTNLKILTNELPFASNANMMFDERTFEPMYKLSLGQAGSSFTFEVAQKNGIPYSLINRAKKKVEGEKVRFDKTIANLQKERSKLEKTSELLKEEEKRARLESEKMSNINSKIQNKLERYQELYDANQRLIYLGQRMEDLSEKYFNNKDKKSLISELLKTVEIENSKRKKISQKEKKQKQAEEKKVQQEIEQKIEKIREEKKKQKEHQQQVNKTHFPLKVGDRVRMIDGKSVGTIDAIEKGKAIVNYGFFTSKTPLEQLEMVERKK